MVTITWNKNILPEHKIEIESCVNRFLWLLPSWCAFLHINLFEQDSEDTTAMIFVNYDYRDCRIDFFAKWLIQDPKEKLFSTLHEILHAHTCLIANYARTTFDTLCPPNEADKFNKSIQEELRVRHESATQDLAIAIFNNLYKETGSF